MDLNKLIEDAQKSQAKAKTKAEEAKKQAEKKKKDATLAAKYKQLNNYADTLRKSAIPFEATIKRYANRIARGDKLDALERNELNNAISQYNSLQAGIKKAQQDAYNLYTGRESSPPPLTTPKRGSTGAPTGTQPPASGTKPPSPTVVVTPTPTLTPVTTPTPTGASTGAKAGASTDTTKTGDKGEDKPKDGEKPKTKDELYAEAIDTASRLYNMPDIIFKNVKSLGDLLQRYVNDELTDAQFKRELQNDPWYRQNSAEIKARYVQLFNYQDLVKSGQAKGTTDYEQQIARIAKNIQAKARQLRGADIDEADAKLLAQDMYIYNLDGDDAALTERLARFIRPVAGMVRGEPTIGYGGQALQNYQTLQALAKANGFKLEDILPRDAAGNAMTAESTLQNLATGKLDINRVAQDVRKLAAIGQPEYIRNLLGQGYDLEQIYQPYKSRMAAVLEIDPNTINLNDPALRGAITDKGDINLYDYDRMLRKDSRWQFTNQAREEVSNSVLQVLRDFGFMG